MFNFLQHCCKATNLCGHLKNGRINLSEKTGLKRGSDKHSGHCRIPMGMNDGIRALVPEIFHILSRGHLIVFPEAFYKIGRRAKTYRICYFRNGSTFTL